MIRAAQEDTERVTCKRGAAIDNGAPGIMARLANEVRVARLDLWPELSTKEPRVIISAPPGTGP